jgi:hypothetical protein
MVPVCQARGNIFFYFDRFQRSWLMWPAFSRVQLGVPHFYLTTTGRMQVLDWFFRGIGMFPQHILALSLTSNKHSQGMQGLHRYFRSMRMFLQHISAFSHVK